MAGNVYVWSDPGRTSISYHAINSIGVTERYDKRDVNDAAFFINSFIEQGYQIYLDQSWLGVKMKIPDNVRSQLLEKLKMKRALYNKFRSKLLEILGIEKSLVEIA